MMVMVIGDGGVWFVGGGSCVLVRGMGFSVFAGGLICFGVFCSFAFLRFCVRACVRARGCERMEWGYTIFVWEG